MWLSPGARDDRLPLDYPGRVGTVPDVVSRTTFAALALLVSGVLAGAVAGCAAVPPRTDASGWDRVAGQALSTAASEVGVVRRVLQEVHDGRVPAPYARVAVVDAEEALGSAHDSVSGQQAPPLRYAVSGRVDDLLTRADTAVGDGREALVAGERATFPQLVRRLDRLQQELTTAMERRRR